MVKGDGRRKLFVVPLLVSFLALAQVEQATLTGTVTDQTGALVPDVRVVVKNRETGVEIAIKSNGELPTQYTNQNSSRRPMIMVRLPLLDEINPNVEDVMLALGPPRIGWLSML